MRLALVERQIEAPPVGDCLYASSLLRDLRRDPGLGCDGEDSLSASLDRVEAFLQRLASVPPV